MHKVWLEVGLFVFCVAGTALFASAIYVEGYQDGKDDMQVEAVEQGHAEWVTDSSGHSEFQWLSPTQEN